MKPLPHALPHPHDHARNIGNEPNQPNSYAEAMKLRDLS